MPRIALPATLFAALMLLSACDMLGGALGIESPEKVAAAREAEGKAIGGACRNAARAIEDCFALNKKADKAAVFSGWREMNDYMRENQIEAVTPQVVTQVARGKGETADADEAGKPGAPAEKPTEKSGIKGEAAKRAKPKDS